MIEILSAWLFGHGPEDRHAAPLPMRLAAYATATLLSIATLGFLIIALYGTFLRLTDDVTAALLVAATLATAVILILLVVILARVGRRPMLSPRHQPGKEGEELLSLVGQMSESIANKKLSPLLVVGLALTTGLMQGLRK